MMDTETWLTAEQCMEYGLADEYAERDADMSQSSAILQKANLNLEQRISIQKSLAAQLRQLTAEPDTRETMEKHGEVKQEEKTETKPTSLIKTLAGIF